MKPRWHNEFPFPVSATGRKVDGFPPWRKRELYEYTAHRSHPATFQFASKGYVRPDRHFFTDAASVPEAAQLIVPKDLHWPSFVLHDSGYLKDHNGHQGHGLWFSSTLDGEYVWHPVTREEVDRLLRWSLDAAGYPHRARLVWLAVRAGGWLTWGADKRQK